MSQIENLWSRRLARDLKCLLLLCALMCFVPLLDLSPYTLGILIIGFYFALMALAWNLLAGFTGQFSMAPAAFAMIGGYIPALLHFHLGISLWLGIPAAVIGSAALGFLLGTTVLRLKGPYLALTTLAFAEIARVFIGNSHEFTRGDQGLNLPTLMDGRIAYYYFFLALVVLMGVLIFLLMRSKYGGYLLAIRDDADAAESRGIPVVRFKLFAFTISSAICGFAGCMYGTFSQLVSPELGLLQQTGLIISMVVIGGIGSITGPVLGALLVYLSSEWLRDIGNIQLIVFALLVMIFARFFRTGLWGIFLGIYARFKSNKNN